MNTKTFVQILTDAGIDVGRFPEWPKLVELRLVANVAKHAEGDSASKLEEIRPDLFVAPSIRDMPPFLHWKVPRHVYKPLSGEDLYVKQRIWMRILKQPLRSGRDFRARCCATSSSLLSRLRSHGAASESAPWL